MMPAAWQGVGARFDNLIGYINVMQWWVMCVVWGSWGMWVRIRYMHGGLMPFFFSAFGGITIREVVVRGGMGARRYGRRLYPHGASRPSRRPAPPLWLWQQRALPRR